MIRQAIEPAQLVMGTGQVVGNVETTGAVVAGGAGVAGASVPAGVDEVSLLAASASTAHAADFLAVSAVDHALVTGYAASLSAVATVYTVNDAATALTF